MVQAAKEKITVKRDLLIDIIEGVKHGHTKKEIIDQIDLIFDEEAQKAIERGMREYKEGKTKRFSKVNELIEYLNK